MFKYYYREDATQDWVELPYSLWMAYRNSNPDWLYNSVQVGPSPEDDAEVVV